MRATCFQVRLAPGSRMLVCACAEGRLRPRPSELQGPREEQSTGGEQTKAAAPRASYGLGCREGPEKAGQDRLRLFPCPLDIYGAPTVCQCCVTNRAGTTPPCPRGVYSGRKRQRNMPGFQEEGGWLGRQISRAPYDDQACFCQDSQSGDGMGLVSGCARPGIGAQPPAEVP